MTSEKLTKPLPSTILLAMGAALGAFVAAFGILQSTPSSTLPRDAIAIVNGVTIQRADYDRAFAALTEALKKSEGPDENAEALRQRTLDRLIDEELLVQRGIELGLPARDPQLRTQISARVLEVVAMAQDDESTPDEKTLRAFFEKDPGRFHLSGRFRVDVIFFAVPAGSDASKEAEIKRRADDTALRIAKGERFEDVRSAGDPLLVVPPDAPLPIPKLQDYLGATATRAVTELTEGHTTAPIRGTDGYRILRLVEHIEGETPAFEVIRQDVENAYRKQHEDQRLRQFLDRRRAAAHITMAP